MKSSQALLELLAKAGSVALPQSGNGMSWSWLPALLSSDRVAVVVVVVVVVAVAVVVAVVVVVVGCPGSRSDASCGNG
jgi:Flp pilus assembly protein TadB